MISEEQQHELDATRERLLEKLAALDEKLEQTAQGPERLRAMTEKVLTVAEEVRVLGWDSVGFVVGGGGLGEGGRVRAQALRTRGDFDGLVEYEVRFGVVSWSHELWGFGQYGSYSREPGILWSPETAVASLYAEGKRKEGVVSGHAASPPF